MKHLKTYENLKIYEYIICDDIRTDDISIYQLLNSNLNDLSLKIIQRYNKDGIKVYHIEKMIYYGVKYDSLNILYETNDLNDAVENIKIILDSNKYNL